jgi:LAO/AO transport system kinase
MKINIKNICEVIEKIQSGDRRFTARLISECENSAEFLREVSSYIYPLTGKIKYIGIAGSFGVGKSTLIDGLIKSARKENYRVGVVAVDPQSPFTGGAILGDRIRMKNHYTDEGVFIRSVSSRQESVTPEVIVISRILELWGADILFIETAGLGQTQTEISSVTDFVLLAVQPQSGDEIQLMKAGIMEIADIIAVTKCDLLDPYSIKSALMGEFGHKKVKFFETGANLPEKYDLLFEELKTFKPEHKRESLKNTVEWLIIKKFKDEIINRLLTEERLKEISRKYSDPFKMADELFNEVKSER